MNYLSDEEYEFIYSRSPRICVDLLIYNTKGDMLLTKRSIEPYKDHWHFPGGRIKFREPVEKAIERIFKGELGQDLEVNPHMIGFCQFLEEEQKGQLRHSISLVHVINLRNDTDFMIDDNANDIRFFSGSEMPSPIIPSQHEFLINHGYL